MCVIFGEPDDFQGVKKFYQRKFWLRCQGEKLNLHYRSRELLLTNLYRLYFLLIATDI